MYYICIDAHYCIQSEYSLSDLRWKKSSVTLTLTSINLDQFWNIIGYKISKLINRDAS